ncbi:MAG: HDOD domain-containing protein [Gammaproteobacteria bacterium]|nr:HDOD domain-containing protein [Gammaproteobacteria bacterium]MDH5727662.1 HDOD domain-containing protein [Gammaproteobacteria bacterium]
MSSRKKKSASSDKEKYNSYVARQPIFDRELKVTGYELLYRTGDNSNTAGVVDGDYATSQVMLNSFMELDMTKYLADTKGFVNITQSFLDGQFPIPLPKSKVVLEILEDVEPTLKVIHAVEDYVNQGFEFALDDFVFNEKYHSLLRLVKYVKLDVQALGEQGLRHQLAKLELYNVKLIAEKVETQGELDMCMALGFEYFQGYFLAKPNLVKGRKLPPNKVPVLRLLSRLQDPEVEFEELDDLVRQDAALSYKLLRYANSAGSGAQEEVESVQHALMMLGLQTLRRWVLLIVLAGLNEKSDELLRTALFRAKMCEYLAKLKNIEHEDEFFTVGLFSTLDAMMDLSMKEILEALPLAKTAKKALLKYEGELGEVLSCVIAYEHGQWDKVSFKNLKVRHITRAYLKASAWADKSLGSISS